MEDSFRVGNKHQQMPNSSIFIKKSLKMGKIHHKYHEFTTMTSPTLEKG